MSRLTKALLGIAVLNLAAAALFLTDAVDVSAIPGLYVTFPFAVIFFAAFFISWLMQEEVAAYDAEQRAHHKPTARAKPSRNLDWAHDHECQSPSSS